MIKLHLHEMLRWGLTHIPINFTKYNFTVNAITSLAVQQQMNMAVVQDDYK
jgi:hypothetical protein